MNKALIYHSFISNLLKKLYVSAKLIIDNDFKLNVIFQSFFRFIYKRYQNCYFVTKLLDCYNKILFMIENKLIKLFLLRESVCLIYIILTFASDVFSNAF